MTVHDFYVAGRAEGSTHMLKVMHKYSGEKFAEVALADASAVDRAVSACVLAEQSCAQMPAYERRRVLEHCAEALTVQAEAFAQTISAEAGKPITASRAEVTRSIDVFRIAAEEATRLGGEVLPLDRVPSGKDSFALIKRVPVGACSFITPFNFPLNLVAHKVAPAIAAGCPFVLKPASSTPVSALLLGAILADAALPEGAFSILPCERQAADILVTDARIKLISFTGSAEVGWDIKSRAGKKLVVLELGGNAAVIVDEGVDIQRAADRIVYGAFNQAGQSCISVQRILAHKKVYEELRSTLISRAQSIKVGDPRHEDTVVGPLISEKDAERLVAWTRSAVENGARLLCGGSRQGAVFMPTLLEGVADTEPLYAEEAFGPIAIMEPFDDFEQALSRVNQSRFGLQAGVFTNDIQRGFRAWDALQVGGVILNDVPTWRADVMPYGGVKDSGLEREGPRSAIEHLTEKRVLVIRET